MSADHIDTVAQAGFAEYFAARAGYTWRTAPFPVIRRWTLIAAAFCNGNHDGHSTLGTLGTLGTARKVRSAYTDGITCAPHSFRTDRDWQRVYTAMARARDVVMVRDEVAA